MRRKRKKIEENKKIEEILDDPQLPLFNRAIGGAYPPGSTFKIITASAGLEEGKLNSQTLIEDPGEIVIDKYHYTNWYFTQYGRLEGKINVMRAIVQLSFPFFVKIGRRKSAD